MNKSIAKRLISKQEAMVLLGGLDLSTCSETIESVSISNSQTLRDSDEKHVDKTFINKYKSRPRIDDNKSIHAYFHMLKNSSTNKATTIPHFVGVSGQPTFPVTETYARHVLTVYKPWRTYPKKLDWINAFENFINSKECPASARMGYDRVMMRYYDKMMHYDPKATQPDHSKNPTSDDDLDLLALLSLNQPQFTDAETAMLKELDLGVEHKWDHSPLVSTFVHHSSNKIHARILKLLKNPGKQPLLTSITPLMQDRQIPDADADTPPEKWLMDKVTQFESHQNDNLWIPK